MRIILRGRLTKLGRVLALTILCISLQLAGLTKVDAASLNRGVSTEPNSLDPHYVSGNSGATIVYDFFEGLLTQDAAGHAVPGVAESWSISEDGTLYVFKLRPNLVWSDKTALTAADFEYSLRRIADPKNAALAARHVGFIKNAKAILAGELETDQLGVRAVDDRTLEIEFERPTAYALQILAHHALAPVPKHVIDAKGSSWTLPENIVVNGPYRLAEWLTSSYMMAVKNPDYHGAAEVQIDTVYYFPVEKTTTALMRFRADELDVIRTVPLNQLDWIEETYPNQLRRDPIAALAYLLINHEKEATKDVRVRKALSISINRELIGKSLIRDAVGSAYNLVPPKLADYGPNDPPTAQMSHEERLAEAKSLLNAAGYDEDNPLSITLKFGGQEKSRKTAIAIQAMWKEIGIDAELANVGGRSVSQDAKNGDYQILRYNYFAPLPDPIVFLNLVRTGQIINHSRYSNPAYDALLDKADAILDNDIRFEALRAAEQMVMDDFPVIPIYFDGQFALLSKRVRGWEDNPKGDHLTRYLWIEED